MELTITSDNQGKKLKALLSRYKDSYTVEAGYPSSVASTLHPNVREEFYRDENFSSESKPVGAIAYKLNYGGDAYQKQANGKWKLITIPPRPFMAMAAQDKSKFTSFLQLAVSSMNQGQSIDKVLGIIGELYVEKIKSAITESETPPNSFRTADIKQSSNPLIDTGQMRNIVTYEIKKE